MKLYFKYETKTASRWQQITLNKWIIDLPVQLIHSGIKQVTQWKNMLNIVRVVYKYAVSRLVADFIKWIIESFTQSICATESFWNKTLQCWSEVQWLAK